MEFDHFFEHNQRGRMKNMLSLGFAFIAVIAASSSAGAAVTLPALVSDNMVLQQGAEVAIWGAADPGEQVTVAFQDQKVVGTADREGRWKVTLGPLNAGGPSEMTIAGKNTLTLHNVVVGEVWLCSGQSNMEMVVEGSVQAEKEIAAANYPMIRHFTVKHTVASSPQNDVEGQWVVASPETAAIFSAVAYFFGRELHQAVGVPVGLIDSSVGGTPAEAWTSRSALEGDPELRSIPEEWQKAEKAEAQGTLASSPPSIPTALVPTWKPAGLYNGMIHPLIQYRIAGAIWYQGESNVPHRTKPFTGWYPEDDNRPYQYRRLFQALILDWRRAWGEDNFPFLFVQLANWKQNYARINSWPELREAQALALSLPKTGMAVAIDIGDPETVHPHNKQEVGRRLALAAESIAYGRNVVYSGPMYQSMRVEDGAVRLRFKHTEDGFVARDGPLQGFEIAGENRKFVKAEASIDGAAIVVRSTEVPQPVAVRYAWADNPECNLYNKSGLPASPFRTDDWPTDDRKDRHMEFDHIGIVTADKKPGEIFIAPTRVWITDFQKHPYRVEWLRYEPDSPVTGPVRHGPHIAYRVDSIADAAKGMKVLLEPFDVGFAVVGFYETDDGAVVEFMEYKE